MLIDYSEDSGVSGGNYMSLLDVIFPDLVSG